MEKRVSINKLDKLIKANEEDRTVNVNFAAGDEEIEIAVKRYLLPHEEYACAQSIASAVFIDGVYAPEVRESATIMNFFAYYTNVKIEAGLDRAYALWYGLPELRERLKYVVNEAQWLHTIGAAQKAIDHRLNMEVSAQAERIDNLMQQIEASTAVLTTFSEAFSTMDGNDLTAAVSKLANMDESKIIDFVAAMQKKEEE